MQPWPLARNRAALDATEQTVGAVAAALQLNGYGATTLPPA